MRTQALRWARRLAALAIVAYALAALAVVIGLRTPAAPWWGLQLAAAFYAWVYLPLPLALLIGATLRLPRAALPLALAGALLLADYGPALLRGPDTSAPATLRVMTWNVLYTTDDAAAISAAIRAERPDIVALQELGYGLAPRLSAALQDAYPYQALAPTGRPDGFGLLSRHPLVDVHEPELTLGSCRCQRATALVGGRRVALINAHPHIPSLTLRRVGPITLPADFSTAYQEPTLDALGRLVAARDAPLLLVGDLNIGDRMRGYGRLRAQLGDAFGAVGRGLGLTYPVGMRAGPLAPPPLVRLDYIFHDDRWQPLAAWDGHRGPSDHRYVVADLRLRETASDGGR